jgi:hypothetical protein
MENRVLWCSSVLRSDRRCNLGAVIGLECHTDWMQRLLLFAHKIDKYKGMNLVQKVSVRFQRVGSIFHILMSFGLAKGGYDL